MIPFLLTVLFAAVILFAVVSMPKNRRTTGRAGRGRGRQSGSLAQVNVAERWGTITAMAAGGGNDLRQAVSEADKLFDYAMKAQGYPGETMADRLRVAQGELSDRNNVWQAHKLRNALAHEVGFDLVPSQAREALASFERGLKDLGAL